MPIVAVRYHIGIACYCISCVALHNLLHKHYLDACSSWVSAISGIQPTTYCAVVRKTLAVLQASPLLVASAVITGAPLLHE
jgi:hypothetical protein